MPLDRKKGSEPSVHYGLDSLRGRTSRDRFINMPKLLGDVSVVELLGVAKDLEGEYNPFDSTVRGQALIEAAILDANTVYNDQDEDDLVEQRLEWLGAAEEELGKATRIHETNVHIEGLYDHLWAYYRTKLYALFLPIYRDLACGDVTEQSLDEVYESLRAFLRELCKEQTTKLPATEEQHLRGLISEAVIPACLIKTMSDAAILPASLRADSGQRDGHVAHDLIYTPFDPETAKIDFDQLRPWQVKGAPEPSSSDDSSSHSSRYDTDQITLIYTRRDMSDPEWNRLLQDLLSMNARTQTTRTIEKFIGSIMDQAGMNDPDEQGESYVPDHPELRKLRGLFSSKK